MNWSSSIVERLGHRNKKRAHSSDGNEKGNKNCEHDFFIVQQLLLWPDRISADNIRAMPCYLMILLI